MFFGCSIYKKIPPATETLSDSYSPVIAMLTSSHACRDFSERPLPSLPKTKHTGVSNMESQKLWEREKTGLINPSCCGCPASNFIWNSSLRDSKWFQLPETIGSWKDAPRLARSAFSLNGSQHPGSRKTPSCWQKINYFMIFNNNWNKLQGYTVFRICQYHKMISSEYFKVHKWSIRSDFYVYWKFMICLWKKLNILS